MKRFTTSDEQQTFLKFLIYGISGAGKTYLLSTVPEPERAFICSVEAGSLSLSRVSIEGAQINSMKDANECYEWLKGSDEAKQFNFIQLDSITELAEICLAEELPAHKDPRKAFGAMMDRMKRLIRAFRDLPGRHIYMTAKQSQIQDEAGRLYFGPDMPGQKLGPGLPYWFDEVFALRLNKQTDPASGVVETARTLQTLGDDNYIAKDRSGLLNEFEPPNLAHIMNKILKGEINESK